MENFLESINYQTDAKIVEGLERPLNKLNHSEKYFRLCV
jgi:hypothetical protein